MALPETFFFFLALEVTGIFWINGDAGPTWQQLHPLKTSAGIVVIVAATMTNSAHSHSPCSAFQPSSVFQRADSI